VVTPEVHQHGGELLPHFTPQATGVLRPVRPVWVKEGPFETFGEPSIVREEGLTCHLYVMAM
jgi:hypothetical protein